LPATDLPAPERRRTATRGKRDTTEVEEFNDEARANRIHIEQSLEILVGSMEDRASAVFSTLAQAVAQCVRETSSPLPKDEGKTRVRRKRENRRQAELRSIGRLNRTGSRMLDACIRLRATYDRSETVPNITLAAVQDIVERAGRNAKPQSGES
jgi:hypothetical protein